MNDKTKCWLAIGALGIIIGLGALYLSPQEPGAVPQDSIPQNGTIMSEEQATYNHLIQVCMPLYARCPWRFSHEYLLNTTCILINTNETADLTNKYPSILSEIFEADIIGIYHGSQEVFSAPPATLKDSKGIYRSISCTTNISSYELSGLRDEADARSNECFGKIVGAGC